MELLSTKVFYFFIYMTFVDIKIMMLKIYIK